MRFLISLIVLACVLPSRPLAQSLGLAGQWQRVDPVTVGAADDASPAWEQLTVDGTSITLQRSAQATRTEAYTVDNVERAVARVPGHTRTCRARWENAAFVLECHQTDSGPGGTSPSIGTVEYVRLDSV